MKTWSCHRQASKEGMRARMLTENQWGGQLSGLDTSISCRDPLKLRYIDYLRRRRDIRCHQSSSPCCETRLGSFQVYPPLSSTVYSPWLKQSSLFPLSYLRMAQGCLILTVHKIIMVKPSPTDVNLRVYEASRVLTVKEYGQAIPN
ncbi:hypothetical protein RRG08_023510 [Elysia crispata]|uniref:Uncharacterized protein n=1 Tax=Elysia crispata TaxID=231223 RepID=A0AAE1D6R7_9GAST|nr:hypothetical protein RRG08_023510 [Elysia crispata]